MKEEMEGEKRIKELERMSKKVDIRKLLSVEKEGEEERVKERRKIIGVIIEIERELKNMKVLVDLGDGDGEEVVIERMLENIVGEIGLRIVWRKEK